MGKTCDIFIPCASVAAVSKITICRKSTPIGSSTCSMKISPLDGPSRILRDLYEEAGSFVLEGPLNYISATYYATGRCDYQTNDLRLNIALLSRK